MPLTRGVLLWHRKSCPRMFPAGEYTGVLSPRVLPFPPPFPPQGRKGKRKDTQRSERLVGPDAEGSRQ